MNPKNSDFKVSYIKSKGKSPTHPHFTLKLEGNLLYYNGISNTPILGAQNFEIEKSKFKKITEAFQKSNFSNFDKLYQGNIRDLSMTSIIYKNHEVKFQSKQAPKELKELALLLESLLTDLKN